MQLKGSSSTLQCLGSRVTLKRDMKLSLIFSSWSHKRRATQRIKQLKRDKTMASLIKDAIVTTMIYSSPALGSA